MMAIMDGTLEHQKLKKVVNADIWFRGGLGVIP